MIFLLQKKKKNGNVKLYLLNNKIYILKIYSNTNKYIIQSLIVN